MSFKGAQPGRNLALALGANFRERKIVPSVKNIHISTPLMIKLDFSVMCWGLAHYKITFFVCVCVGCVNVCVCVCVILFPPLGSACLSHRALQSHKHKRQVRQWADHVWGRCLDGEIVAIIGGNIDKQRKQNKPKWQRTVL